MRVHLIHGFNVRDGGAGTIGRMAPHLRAAGHEVVNHSYGWVGLLGLRRRNAKVVERLLAEVKPGDAIMAHSNGCLIAWELVEAGAPLAAVVCIQPALRRDTRWARSAQVLCLHNPGDWVVSMGRMWGRFATRARPWRNRHGWGAAGRHGFTSRQPNVYNWDTSDSAAPAVGHSGIFKRLGHWAPLIDAWLSTRMLVAGRAARGENHRQG